MLCDLFRAEPTTFTNLALRSYLIEFSKKQILENRFMERNGKTGDGIRRSCTEHLCQGKVPKYTMTNFRWSMHSAFPKS